MSSPQHVVALESDTNSFGVSPTSIEKAKLFGWGLHQVCTQALRTDINSIPKWVALNIMRDAIFRIATEDAFQGICIVISFRCCPRIGPGLDDHHAFRFGETIVAHHRGQILKDIIGEWPALII